MLTKRTAILAALLATAALVLAPASQAGQRRLVVLGYNDLGMHCMNQDFSEFMILPPYNTLHAQVIDKTCLRSKIVTDGVTVRYRIPGNTYSVGKTNFWDFVEPLLGVTLPPNIGLSGNGLWGKMKPTGAGDWSATGIPLTPTTDRGKLNPFQLSEITVMQGAWPAARTYAVAPVSWELRCDLCHHGGMDAPKSVLEAHDLLHGTTLYDPATGGPANGKPVLCGGCHGQPELGLPGAPDTENLSLAMHKAHSPRMGDVVDSVPSGVVCWACHPGPQTECLRDVHVLRGGMTCYNCHGGGTTDFGAAMDAVADPARQPWVSEPRCSDCHHRPGSEYEQAGTLFRNSVGHGGVFCEACHNSTHALTPARDLADNTQSILLQGYAGPIKRCTACHAVRPNRPFVHRYVAAAKP